MLGWLRTSLSNDDKRSLGREIPQPRLLVAAGGPQHKLIAHEFDPHRSLLSEIMVAV